MKKEIDIVVSPEKSDDTAYFKTLAANQLNVFPQSISHLKLLKRSIDARSRNVKFHLRLDIYYDEPLPEVPQINNIC